MVKMISFAWKMITEDNKIRSQKTESRSLNNYHRKDVKDAKKNSLLLKKTNLLHSDFAVN